MQFHAVVHEEDGQYWAEVRELPGCFASGRTLDEVAEGLREAIPMYLGETASAERRSEPPTFRLDELTLVAV